MSIEKTMEALTEALNKHTDALNAFVKKAGSGGAATGSAGASSSTAGKASGGKATGKKLTKEQLTDAFGAYLSVKDKDEKRERATNVKAISDHFGVERISMLEEEDWPKAMAYLKQLNEGETPDFMQDDGDGDGEGDSII